MQEAVDAATEIRPLDPLPRPGLHDQAQRFANVLLAGGPGDASVQSNPEREGDALPVHPGPDVLDRAHCFFVGTGKQTFKKGSHQNTMLSRIRKMNITTKATRVMI